MICRADHKDCAGMFDELVVDNFAGGGGASMGIEMAIGRSVDIAINHDQAAVAMHRINHPRTRHYCEDVWKVDPVEVTDGRPVGLAWFSPDCKHFSKAKGGAPVSRRVRGLAWVVIRWARAVRPRIITLENVEEFKTWGPVSEDGRPCKEKSGETFRSWVGKLRGLGYNVQWRELRACDYGAPTIRKRLFLVARCDGLPIVWPEPTHGPWRPSPWRTAADVIDFSLPCQSIFGRKRPLAENTLARIARGIDRYVVNTADPFVVTCNHAGDHFRGQSIREPFKTITASRDAHGLVTSHLVKLRGTCKDGQPVTAPMPTITAGGNHVAEVRAFLVKYYGTAIGQNLRSPIHTITTKDRLGLVMVRGTTYQISDIGMRMLTPRELFLAQGFPSGYVIDQGLTEFGVVIRLTKTEQVRMCGNSVVPLMAKAIVEVNYKNEGVLA